MSKTESKPASAALRAKDRPNARKSCAEHPERLGEASG
jgi:hypothetical protein